MIKSSPLVSALRRDGQHLSLNLLKRGANGCVGRCWGSGGGGGGGVGYETVLRGVPIERCDSFRWRSTTLEITFKILKMMIFFSKYIS